LVQTGRCQGINFVEDGFEMRSGDVVAFDFPKYHFCIAAVELMNGQLAFQPMQVTDIDVARRSSHPSILP
jgi:hypothetical protein